MKEKKISGSEFALQSVVQPMGVSTYTVKESLLSELKNALPSREELETKINEINTKKE